ncbi:adenosylmethionine decarboxylase [Nisaea sp.]|uniref:adenosylmethionine decarboxylase n=1 Tax=Nisaea sp. TaxID=2024842 RepID=UPI0032F06416
MDRNVAFADLGMDSDTQPSRTNSDTTGTANNDGTVVQWAPTHSDASLDHFVKKDGLVFAGTHLIIDLVGASRLDELAHVEETLREAVEVSGATLLHIHLHHFTPNGGVSGVAVLAESHISIHTWPERGYAALDVFMCGDAEPHKAIAVLRRAFRPDSIQLNDLKRGLTV